MSSIEFPADKINLEDGIGAVKFNRFRLPVINAIRRTIHSDVPSVAMRGEPHSFKTIHIRKNTTPLNHQFLTHRISLIPVNLPVPLSGQESVLSKYEIRIQKENPLDSGVENVLVSTDDIRVINTETGKELPDGERAIMFPRDRYCNEGILIATLKKGQELDVQAHLAVGTGAEHACFKPTSQCSYEFGVSPEIAEKMRAEQLKELVAGKAGVDDAKYKEIEAQFDRTFRLLDIQRAVERDADGNPLEILFFIESVLPQRNPFRILVEATEVLLEKLTILRIAIQSEDPKKIEILFDTKESLHGGESESKDEEPEVKTGVKTGSDFVVRFYKEGHTIGGLLQETLLKHPMVVRDIDNWFIGYRLPHPLTQEMVLKVSHHHSPEFNKEILKTILIETIHSLAVEFGNIHDGIVDYINKKGFPAHPLKHLIAMEASTAAAAPAPAPAVSGSGDIEATTTTPTPEREEWTPGEIVGEARKHRRKPGLGGGADLSYEDAGDDLGDW
jgi:DNA-directed RNA polymerase subunit L